MMRFLLLLIIFLSFNAQADSGGYDASASAGGYDPSIAQREELAEQKRIASENEAIRKANIAAAKKREQQRRSEREKAETARVIAKLKKDKENAPGYLESKSDLDMCVLYGSAIRGEMGVYDNLSFEGAADMVKNEAKRINLKVNTKLARNPTLKIGMSICDLFAAYGYPEENNRTVSAAGVYIQHVFDTRRIKAIVYTENGIVTSWQD